MAWFTYNIKLLYLSIFGYLETMAIPLYYVWKKNFEKTFNFATFFSYFSLISIKKYCPKLDFLLPEKWNQFFRILGYFLEQFQRFSCCLKMKSVENKTLSLNQNVWRDHATMQQDVLLHFFIEIRLKYEKKYSVVQLLFRAFSLSTLVDNSEATWKKATKCNKRISL